MAESKKSTSYGAVDVPKGGADAGHFDEKNTLYLRDKSKFDLRHFSRSAVPIVIALLIMGGFTYGMLHGFNHFYGPPKSDGGDTPGIVESKGAYQCSANERCSKLDLIGNCCPTNEGVILKCCD